ncbi:MAG TPA: PD-(D/E)XK nuclease family protein [Solirubrobacter sp.]|nr:PD-(D/E)XK nuclease family protein [Solirubrobacter sp.]
MSALAAPTRAARPPTGAELAARIQIPRRLPVRYDGERLQHLSHSSYTKFLLCPDDWRRHYLKGDRPPPSGHMFLGARVDDALSTYYHHELEHGERLTLDQVHDAYRDHWTRELAEEAAKQGVRFDLELDEARAFTLGLEAIALTTRELVPRLGRPVAVQRELSYTLAPGLEWTIQGFLDLETLRADDDRPDVVPAIVDYKVKNTLHSQAKADQDPQAGLYLAGRWLSGQPAEHFCFAQIGKPGKRRKTMNTSLVVTRRTPAQLRATLVRIAQAASQISALYERYGPDEPWGFADPSGWKCSARYCGHYTRCPGGGGI